MAEHRRIYAYYRGLLKHWERDLNARPDEAKRTLQVGGGGVDLGGLLVLGVVGG